MGEEYQKFLHVKVLINGNELNSYSFDEEQVNIGRGSDCLVVLDNPGISRVHATLQREGENIRIFDMESGNGTFVNGNAVDKAWVTSSDTIRIGKFTLNVRLSPLRVGAPEVQAENNVASRPDEASQTVALSADDRKKILQQAQALKANIKPASGRTNKGVNINPFVLVFVAGSVFGWFVSWLFG